MTDVNADELLYYAWAVIANVGFHKGGWEDQHPGWIHAAEHWRDEWHNYLREHPPTPTEEPL